MKRFLITDFEEEESMDLFALHSPIESYLLAYKLNQKLNIKFKNATEQIDPQSDQPFFNRYVWSSTDESPAWELIANHYVFSKQETEEEVLFSLKTEQKKTLIDALSQVNYFLKVPQESIDKPTLTRIQNMGEVQLIYPITDTKIKQNPNLIFD